ncbi:MAG: hypothetical protein A2097_04365 [Desulfobacula sp. GWF2_41_7]|nr:MAG: hypothetical protein A2097_04365 [Desulfobacula sp. GWF2_41_7]
MRKTLFCLIGFWIAVTSLSFFYSFRSIKLNHEKLILQTARSLFDAMVIIRKWNSLHNGVYVLNRMISVPGLAEKNSLL